MAPPIALPPPIALTLTVRRPQTLVGEQIVFGLGIRVERAITLDMPELNRDRTTIHLQSKDPAKPKNWKLTGADYMRLFHVHPLSQVGGLVAVEAGRQWTAELNLSQYTTALPAGPYAASVSYRYGAGEAETVSTNTVEFSVAPAALGHVSYRWFGGAKERETLGSIAVVVERGNEEWLYQVASRRNPGAVETAVRLGRPARKAGAKPVLAHLNDIEAMHFSKYALWEEGGELGAVKVNPGGRGGEPRFVRHGLRAGARLIDPPLHQHHGGVMAMLTGQLADNRPGLALVTLGAEGPGESRLLPLDAAPTEALALWPAEEGAPTLYLQVGGRWVARRAAGGLQPVEAELPLESLALSQWMGTGVLYGHFRSGAAIRTYERRLGAAAAGPGQRYEAAGTGRFVAAAWREPGGVALLLENDGGGWVVLDGGQRYPIPAARQATGQPILLPAGKAIYVLQHEAERGFVAMMVGTAPPEALV
ncbi:MAG: hypothetical protein INH43_25155 [Acidobacteriaceae bacterium]|nr:hypothetical protein [Acidobacteriaceae bacterium]